MRAIVLEHAGVIGMNDDILRCQQQGFRLIGLGSDAGMVLRQLRLLLGRQTGREILTSWF